MFKTVINVTVKSDRRSTHRFQKRSAYAVAGKVLCGLRGTYSRHSGPSVCGALFIEVCRRSSTNSPDIYMPRSIRSTSYAPLQYGRLMHSRMVQRETSRHAILTGLLAITLTSAGGMTQAQGLVSPCTGISLPASSVFNFLDPVLGPVLGSPVLSVLGLGSIYTSLSKGDPLALNVLDTEGNLLSANDGCKVASDSYSLSAPGGVAIGGNSITGLGTDGAINQAKASELNSIAIGDRANTGTGATNAVALGSGAIVTSKTDGAIALGAGSKAAGGLIAAYVPVGGTYTVTADGPGAQRELSIGSVGAERRITNVAAGGADTDAVNVSQLKSVATLSVCRMTQPARRSSRSLDQPQPTVGSSAAQ
jgi:hypothetical protein